MTPGHGGRVERRPDVIRGRISFVSIHTRPTVARDPSPEVYRVDREARQTHFPSERGEVGGIGVKGFPHAAMKNGVAPSLYTIECSWTADGSLSEVKHAWFLQAPEAL